jgi:hypothetical protein
MLGYNRYTCTLMFIVALFTIAVLWKQPWCPNWRMYQENVVHIHNSFT